jgi:hypothetical protein
MLADSSELGVARTLLGWYPFLSLRGQMTRRIAAAPAHLLAATTLPTDSDAPPSTSNTLPSGAEPKPSGPLIRLSLMLMIPRRLRSRGLASRPLSLTFTKRFGWTQHPTGVRSCHVRRPGFEVMRGQMLAEVLGVLDGQAPFAQEPLDLGRDQLANSKR